MRPPARPWSRRILILIAILICSMYPSSPIPVVYLKHSAVNKTENAAAGHPLKKKETVGFLLALAALLQTGRQ
jgi:hypothetical protein